MKRYFIFSVLLVAVLSVNAQPLNPPTPGPAVPLPIRLADFVVTAGNGVALIGWQTLHEANSKHFEIEHSLDGVQWVKLGTINAAGTSQAVRSYAFTHAVPAAGQNYYRLKTVYLDGVAEWSTIRRVAFNASTLIKLYPVPVADFLVVEIKGHEKNLPYTILDAAGRQLKRGIIIHNGQRLWLKDLEPGVYFFKPGAANPIKFSKQ